MKKTFISVAMLAACSVFAAEGTAQTVLFDFGITSLQTTGAINIHGSMVGNGQTTTFNNSSGTLDTIVGNYELSTNTNVGSPGNYAGKGVVIDALSSEEANWKNPFAGTMPAGFTYETLADGLTVQNTNGQPSLTLTLTDLAAGTYDLSIFGAFTGKDKYGTGIITLSQGAQVSTSYYSDNAWTAFTSAQTLAADTAYTLPGINETSTNTATSNGYILNASGITLTEDHSTLSITLTAPSGAGLRTPLNSIQLTYKAPTVPEPATATLSLLALAGLCARRRRK